MGFSQHFQTHPNALQDLSIDPADSRFQPSVVASLHPQDMLLSQMASWHHPISKLESIELNKNHQSVKVLQVTVILNVWWVTIPLIYIDPENSPCLEDSSLPIPFWQGLY